jgi:hypothetical protein
MNLKQIKPIHVKLTVVLFLTSFSVMVAWYGRNAAENAAAVADRAKEHNESWFTLTAQYNNPDWIRVHVVSPYTLIFWVQIIQAVVLLAPMKWPLTETEDATALAVASNA